MRPLMSREVFVSVRPEGSERAHSPIPAAPEGRRTYVIDTSVLLSDPRALLNFAEHHVVVPIVVITELEGKRHHPELGHFARAALRILDKLRLDNGGLVGPVPVNDEGGELLVELNHSDP
ncbi:MAG: PIN domain-containing protein, partial [Cutibacterium avidum]|nr:PIN domain-containing protein [Cutibacterium avidum]